MTKRLLAACVATLALLGATIKKHLSATRRCNVKAGP
jgi:hypothetical protein